MFFEWAFFVEFFGGFKCCFWVGVWGFLVWLMVFGGLSVGFWWRFIGRCFSGEVLLMFVGSLVVEVDERLVVVRVRV